MKRKYYIWIILAIALLFRLNAFHHLSSSQRKFMRGDAPYYHCLAKSILRGQYQISFEDISDEAIKRRKEVLDAKIFFHTAVIDQPTNYWSPGYPLFLAGLYALFGIHFWIPALLGCIIGVLCCYMLWLIASRLVNPTAGLISAAPWAIHPIAVTKSPELESETLGLLLLLVSVYLFLLWRDREGNLGPIKALLLGVMLGMPFYVRSTSGLLVPIFAITLLLNPSWKRLATALLLCSSFILILIPWGIRNQRSLGKFMVFETRGVNVMLGEISRKGYHPPRKNEFKAETELEAWKAQKYAASRSCDPLKSRMVSPTQLALPLWKVCRITHPFQLVICRRSRFGNFFNT